MNYQNCVQIEGIKNRRHNADRTLCLMESWLSFLTGNSQSRFLASPFCIVSQFAITEKGGIVSLCKSELICMRILISSCVVEIKVLTTLVKMYLKCSLILDMLL